MNPAARFTPVSASRRLIRSARSAALATLDAGTGAPFASLVTVATAADGSPLMLLSDLAVHTRNLKADARASLLYDERGPGALEPGDPLTGTRVTLVGRIERVAEPAAERARFLARQPEAEGYAGFRDFAFYRLAVEMGHLVAGFGRIVDLKASDLLLDLAGADEIVAGEAGIVAHLNEDHADAVRLYATRLLGAPDGAWRVTGCDPEGMDIQAEGRTLRLEFPERVRTGTELRKMLVRLAGEARARQ